MRTRRLMWVAVVAWLQASGMSLWGAESNPAPRPAVSPQAWTLDEAVRQALRNRHDPYLQFVAVQLARNENKADEIAEKFDEGRRAFSGFLLPVYSGDPSRQDERQMPQLAGFFTGALAVHENLQLQTLRGAALPAEAPPDQVAVSTLAGVTAEAHPWEKLLAAQLAAGKTPQVSPLTLAVPADQYFVLFRSPGKLLELADVGDLWGQHLLQGLTAPATGQPMVERLTAQVVLPTDRAARPLYDAAVGEVALTGNDLYFREGTDVTFLFALKQPEAFRLFTEAALAAAVKARPDAVRETGAYQGVAYTHVATPDRAIHLFAADPRPGLHVRSNSLTGLRCVLDAIAGRTAGGQPGDATGRDGRVQVHPHAPPASATEEDGLVYLSDAFLRRMVGAAIRLTEHRRLLCYHHLRMIGYAAALHRTQYGRAAESFAELARHGCAPGVFGEGGRPLPVWRPVPAGARRRRGDVLPPRPSAGSSSLAARFRWSGSPRARRKRIGSSSRTTAASGGGSLTRSRSDCN